MPTGYCVKERKKVEIQNPVQVTMRFRARAPTAAPRSSRSASSRNGVEGNRLAAVVGLGFGSGPSRSLSIQAQTAVRPA